MLFETAIRGGFSLFMGHFISEIADKKRLGEIMDILGVCKVMPVAAAAT